MQIPFPTLSIGRRPTRATAIFASKIGRRAAKTSLLTLGAAAGLGLANTRAGQKEFTSGTSLTSSSNYSPTGAPGAGDNIVFDSGSTVSTSLTITAATLNIEDINFSTATAATISNTNSGTAASTLELNGGRGTGFPLLDENSTKTLTIKNGSTGALNLLLGASGSFEIDNTGNLTISSNITQVNAGTSLTIAAGTNGTGVVNLAGTNSFSGGLNVTSGEVDVVADANLGAAGGSVTINGGRLGITGTFTVDPTRSIFLGANPSGGNATGTLSISAATSVVTINNALQNLAGSTGDLVKQGKGTLQLGNASAYSGNTFLNNGTIQLVANGSASTGNLPSTTTLNLGQSGSANTGVFDLNGISQQIAGLNSITGVSNTTTNTVTSSTGTATLTLGGSGSYAFGDGSATNSGVITGTVAINKTGSGSQTFGGANTYTGKTVVAGGTLLLSANGSINNSPLVQVTTGGALTLGNAATLADAGTLSLVSGTTLNLNATSGSEVIANLILDGASEPAGTYTAAQLSALDNMITFSSSGETLTVTPVPEPATVFGGVLLVGALGWSQRRHWRGLAAKQRLVA